jgi:hypothetical protein
MPYRPALPAFLARPLQRTGRRRITATKGQGLNFAFFVPPGSVCHPDDGYIEKRRQRQARAICRG